MVQNTIVQPFQLDQQMVIGKQVFLNLQTVTNTQANFTRKQLYLTTNNIEK